MIPIEDTTRKQLSALALLLVSIIVLSVLPAFTTKDEPAEVVVEGKPVTTISQQMPNPFDDIELVAHAAYVYDLLTGEVIFAQNEELQMPLASVTKIMTALVAHELVPEYNTVTISPEAIAQEGDSGFYINEKWRLKDLIDYTLISSSNDGARALASVASAFSTTTLGETIEEKSMQFVDRMNMRAEEIGLVQTYFKNESGLDVADGVPGAYGSARDMAHLLGYILDTYPDLLDATKYEALSVESLHELSHSVMNTNIAATRIPGLIGSKTGYTDVAGGNLVIAFDAGIGHPVAVSVLGSTIDERFSDVEKLVAATLDYFLYVNN